MAKETKVKFITPSNDDDGSDSDICEPFFKGIDKKAISKIKKLLEEIASQEDLLERQEDLLILIKERNLALEASLAKEKEKVKDLTKNLSKVNETYSSLKESNDELLENFTSLKSIHKELEVKFDNL